MDQLVIIAGHVLVKEALDLSTFIICLQFNCFCYIFVTNDKEQT
jgi:hypothetical protein